MIKQDQDLSIPLDLEKVKKNIKNKIKDDIFKDRYKKTQKGYVIDRFMFRIMFYLILAAFFLVASSYNFDLDYYECKAMPHVIYTNTVQELDINKEINILNASKTPEGYCKNRFYKNTSWKNEEFLTTGEYGVNPSEWFNKSLEIMFLIVALAFLLNHLIHNRRGCKK